MNPFDLSGIDFIGLYLAVLAAAIVAANRLRRAMRAPAASPTDLI